MFFYHLTDSYRSCETIILSSFYLREILQFSLLQFDFMVLQTATKVETHSCRHAMKPVNKEKNQNQKCIPCT